jgi:hypothetical protein
MFMAVYDCAPPIVRFATNIAPILGARQKDILRLDRKQIAEGILHIQQSKTRMKGRDLSHCGADVHYSRARRHGTRERTQWWIEFIRQSAELLDNRHRGKECPGQESNLRPSA